MPADYTYDNAGDVEELREGPLFYSVSVGNCWRSTWSDQKGRFIYKRKVFLRVSWCARGGLITYWSPETWPEVGDLCGVTWGPAATREGGGVGSSSVTVKSRAVFTCRFGFGIPDQTSDVDVDVKFKADGSREDV